jgi:hypothetical protein
MTDIEPSQAIGEHIKKYMKAYNLLKHLLDGQSQERVMGYIAGLSEARAVVLGQIEESRDDEAN